MHEDEASLMHADGINPAHVLSEEQDKICEQAPSKGACEKAFVARNKQLAKLTQEQIDECDKKKLPTKSERTKCRAQNKQWETLTQEQIDECDKKRWPTKSERTKCREAFGVLNRRQRDWAPEEGRDLSALFILECDKNKFPTKSERRECREAFGRFFLNRQILNRQNWAPEEGRY